MSYPVQSCPTDVEQAEKARAAGWKVDYPKPVRPAEPHGQDDAWYRGWECGWDEMRARYTTSGYVAYKGGADLDAPTVDAGTWSGLLDAVDEQEDE